MPEFSTVPKSARIRTRGQLTIPQEIFEKPWIWMRVQPSISLESEKALLITLKRLQRASLAKAVGREMKREGLTLKDLVAELRAQRRRYVEEKYPRD